MFEKAVFGTRVRALREKRNETQTALAKTLGVSANQVSEMEMGRKTTSFERLCLLCDHFNVTADYLLGRTDEER